MQSAIGRVSQDRDSGQAGTPPMVHLLRTWGSCGTLKRKHVAERELRFACRIEEVRTSSNTSTCAVAHTRLAFGNPSTSSGFASGENVKRNCKSAKYDYGWVKLR